MPTAAQCLVTPDDFRHVIGHFAIGVAIVTTHLEGVDHGMTASAIASLSLDPPMLTVSLHRRSPKQDAVDRSGRLAVNILREGQDDLVRWFAAPRPEKFAAVDVSRSRNNLPLLRHALATTESSVEDAMIGGTHRVFLARVEQAEVDGDVPSAPLAYFRGSFGRLAPTDRRR